MHVLVDEVLDPRAFFVAPGAALRIQRSERKWDVVLDHETLVTVQIANDATLTVSRHVELRGQGWIREHVGTIDLRARDPKKALAECVRMALVGTSRLGISSIESPLPAFALGRIGYIMSAEDALEAALRAGMPVDDSTIDAAVLRPLFNRLALSPYTRLVENLVGLFRHVRNDPRFGDEFVADTISYMLRHLARHLTAFDLVRFHNSGANYPDALLLDALLREYLPLAASRTNPLATPTHRRALRQAWLTRKRLEGISVPDHPTSPGENARIVAGVAPLPEQQLTNAASRRLKLFDHDPAEALLNERTRQLLAHSIIDLDNDAELRELGVATYLDRPLGAAKHPDEPDRTPLLSYESFSRRIAETRVREIHALGLINADRRDALLERLREMAVAGVSVARVPGHGRGGVVALEDAKKASMDFIFTRTTTSSLAELWRQYDLSPLRWVSPDVARWLEEAKRVLLIRQMRLVAGRPQTVLAANDDAMTLRAEFSLGDARYVEHGGREYLVGGLKVLTISGRAVDDVTLPVKEW